MIDSRIKEVFRDFRGREVKTTQKYVKNLGFKNNVLVIVAIIIAHR